MMNTLKVEGMHCAHCAAAVKGAVAGLAGIGDVLVDLEGKTVSYTSDGSVSQDAVVDAIQDQGYDVEF